MGVNSFRVQEIYRTRFDHKNDTHTPDEGILESCAVSLFILFIYPLLVFYSFIFALAFCLP